MDSKKFLEQLEQTTSKQVLIGAQYKLHKKNPPKTKGELERWASNLFGGFSDDSDASQCQVAQWLWISRTKRIEYKSEYPQMGIPENEIQLDCLCAQHDGLGRIIMKKDLIAAGLTSEERNIIPITRELERIETIVGDNAAVEKAAAKKIVRSVKNKLAEWLSGGYKKTWATYSEAENIEAARKRMEKLHSLVTTLCEDDCVELIEEGQIRNYSEMMNTLSRIFTLEDEKLSMLGLFKSIDDIINDGDRNVESKIRILRVLAGRFMITLRDEEKYPQSEDWPEDRGAQQSMPESYGPFLNICFMYMISAQSRAVNIAQWERVDQAFVSALGGRYTYKKWHSNRVELYELITKHVKLNPKSNSAYVNELDEFDDEGDIDKIGRGARNGGY